MSPACCDDSARRWTLPTLLAILLIGAGLTTGLVMGRLRTDPADIIPTPGSGTASTDLPANLFRDWPAGKRPDVALILTGQQHSYLKFCGCTSPQLGGFERRYNLMKKLKERGWPLVAADLGDLVEYTGGLHDQALLKYETAMLALEALEYSAIGLGADDFGLGLQDAMSRFTLQKPERFPRVLAANLDPAYRNLNLPHPNKPNESMIGDWIPVDVKGGPKVGIGSFIGANTIKKIQSINPAVQFANNQDGAIITALHKAMSAAKVEFKVLLFQGPAAAAPAIATQFPDAFNVILALSDEDFPPIDPIMVGNTTIIRAGHRGKYIVVVGAFRTGNPAKPFNLFYQPVALGVEFETPKDREKENPVLAILDRYAEEVKTQEFLKRTPKLAVPGSSNLPKLNRSYVGTQECAKCHAAEVAIWKNTKHEHAFDALSKVASKPAQRQYDPECISCHVTGFGQKSGYDDTLAMRQLRNVNCENCHGPGSAHVAAPKNKEILAAMSPWKSNPTDLLPTPVTLQKGFDAMAPVEKATYLRVNDMCVKCHDFDNDPHYKLGTYWPQIIHGKNAKAPIPPPGASAQNKP